MSTKQWRIAHSIALLIPLVGIPIAVRHSYGADDYTAAWFLIGGGMILFSAICGHGITARWDGIFIDERNVISLSRFQMFMWTTLILSGYSAFALFNIKLSGTASALNIGVDQNLWALMGIGVTSMVASPLIIGPKKQKPPDGNQVENTFQLLVKQGESKEELSHQGVIFVNKDISAARWTDIFTGEEVGNAAHVDLSRLQMFFFTVVLGLEYSLLLYEAIHAFPTVVLKDGILYLPSLSPGMNMLLLISHGGYLTAKAVSHSQTGETNAKASPAENLRGDSPATEQPPMG